MASIVISDITNTTCRLSLVSLDTSWDGGQRVCKWYFKSGSYPTESNYEKNMISSINGAPEEIIKAWKISRLTPDTYYYCLCCIYSGTTLLASLKKTFSTYPTVAINSLSVSQTQKGMKKANVMWSGSNINGGYYYLYANSYLKSEGSITANAMTRTISFDNFDTYTIELSGDHYNQTFSISKNITLEDYDLTPSYGGATRGYRSLKFTWTGAYDAVDFNAYLYSDDKSYENRTALRYHTFNNLDFATVYTFYVRANGEEKNGDKVFGYSITTLPSPPTLSLTQSKGHISCSYGVFANSKIDSFTFYLYNSSGTLIESKVINNSDKNNITPNGAFTFINSLSDGEYTVKAYTTYNGLNSITSGGGNYVSESISVSFRPSNWYWNGVASGARTDNISYSVWNEFIDRIKEWLEYKGILNVSPGTSVYGSASTMSDLLDIAKMNSTSDGKILTANRFNIARYCIGGMNATGITDKQAGDIVYAAYFATLATKMNNITDN